jgi:perosamine synthetase
MSNLSERLIVAIRKVAGKNKNLFLHEPSLGIEESRNLKECISTNMVSSFGPFVEKFEKEVSNFTKAKYAVSTINGTSALHVALKVIGLKERDEVLIPAFNYIASANATLYCGGIPHFVDINKEDLGIDVEKLEEYLKKNTQFKKNKLINKFSKNIIKAVIPTHVYGHSMDLDKLIFLCKKYNLKIIEDAAEAIGSKYKNKHLGTIGDIGILSFNGNKIITTGGGGMILAKNSNHFNLARHLTTVAKQKNKFFIGHDMMGYNYKLPNTNAALGCAQIKKIRRLIQLKRQLSKKYISELINIPEVEVLKEKKGSRSNYWLNTIILKGDNYKNRDQIISEAHKNNIFVRPAWKCLSQNKYLKNFPKMNLKNTINLQKRILNLPSSPHLISKI